MMVMMMDQQQQQQQQQQQEQQQQQQDSSSSSALTAFTTPPSSNTSRRRRSRPGPATATATATATASTKNEFNGCATNGNGSGNDGKGNGNASGDETCTLQKGKTNSNSNSSTNSNTNSNGITQPKQQQKQPKQQKQKVRNTSALLDQYQDDDDLTTNLIHAIRSWNLQRPPPPPEPCTVIENTDMDNYNYNYNYNDCSSTINTLSSDLDTATANSAVTLTSSSSATGTGTTTPTPTLASTAASNLDSYNCANVNLNVNVGGTGASSSCGSTITNVTSITSATSATSATVGTNGSNATNGSSASASASAVKKTPCRGNYSSRPSGLTARILLENNDNDSVDVDVNAVANIDAYADVDVDVDENDSGKANVTFEQHRKYDERINGNVASASEVSKAKAKSNIPQSDCHDNIDRGEEGIHQTRRYNEIINPADENTPSSAWGHGYPQNQTGGCDSVSSNSIHSNNNPHPHPGIITGSSTNSTPDIDAMATLQEIAHLLNLDPNDNLHKVLPTVKKLVRVIYTHVPNLEQFVDEVCSVVRVELEEEEREKERREHTAMTSMVEGHLQDGVFDGGCEGSGLESGMETDDCQDDKRTTSASTSTPSSAAGQVTTKKKRRRSRRQQRKKKTLLARKQKMDDTVRILRRDWQDRAETSRGSDTSSNIHCKRHLSATKITTASSSPSSLPLPLPSQSQSKSPASRRALQKVNVNNIDSRDHCDNLHTVKAKSFESLSVPNDEQSYFRTAVVEKLKRRRQCHQEALHPQEQQGPHESQESQGIYSYDDEQALSIIENLICFEQKYIKVCSLQPQKDSFSSSLPSSLSSSSIIQSPPQSNSILRDLFDMDSSSLRQFVLHFAYLFSVQQDEIMNKMNDVYVFSHEAAIMIEKIRQAMGLSPTCPIQSVTKKVVDFVEQFSSEGLGVVPKSTQVLSSKSKSMSMSMSNPKMTLKSKSKPKSKPKPSSLAPNTVQQPQPQRNHHVRFNVVVEEFE